MSATDLFKLKSKRQEAVFSCFEAGFAHAANISTDSVAVDEMWENGEQVEFSGRRLADTELLVAYEVAGAIELTGVFLSSWRTSLASLKPRFLRISASL